MNALDVLSLFSLVMCTSGFGPIGGPNSLEPSDFRGSLEELGNADFSDQTYFYLLDVKEFPSIDVILDLVAALNLLTKSTRCRGRSEEPEYAGRLRDLER